MLRNEVIGLTIIACLAITGCASNHASRRNAVPVQKQAGPTALGTLVGAAIGGTAGALIDNHMDKQAEELRQALNNAHIERLAEGIKITFDSDFLYKPDSSLLTVDAKNSISLLANVLTTYPNTDILIEGHTDSVGAEEYKLTLSKERAMAVKDHLLNAGIKGYRVNYAGYGDHQPIADNTIDSGRHSNRRVEMAISANKQMKKAAQNGSL